MMWHGATRSIPIPVSSLFHLLHLEITSKRVLWERPNSGVETSGNCQTTHKHLINKKKTANNRRNTEIRMENDKREMNLVQTMLLKTY